ncbi:hypothetical protein SAMN05444503_102131 [Pseudomonas sp. BS3767]|jgi:hypothetical protein|uniref:Uncharacterized protein n=1 Tax=Pseudomonas syringae TaxID=317 RepID=A0AB37ZGE5_PSESX|nr:hypothetical protein PSYRMG_09855 [Pseudomonas syringae UMAF0158]SDG83092.1 hypothetical protein SAMN05444503_102131 [Pseudomonas sp. BS3767]SDL93960.1 hypothetical protein SAMN05444505_101132 [Pseudomonas syringae]SDM24889.1 hypothetical protein SAMN05444502_101131 [Pseudomonas sp. BS3759]
MLIVNVSAAHVWLLTKYELHQLQRATLKYAMATFLT